MLLWRLLFKTQMKQIQNLHFQRKVWKRLIKTSFDNNRTTKFSVKHIQTKSCHLMQQICNKNFYPFDKLNQFFVKPIDIIASIMKVTAAALSILSLLSTCWIHPVSALRNIRQNTEDGVVQQKRQGKYFLCWKVSNQVTIGTYNWQRPFSLQCYAMQCNQRPTAIQHHDLET